MPNEITNTSKSDELDVLIEELSERYDIDDSDLIIVEDKEDTKRATIEVLKRALSGDTSVPNELKFYSSRYMNNKIDEIYRSVDSKATVLELKNLSDRVAQIVASSGEGKDTEIIDARDGELSLHERLVRDNLELEDIKMSKMQVPTTKTGNPITITNPLHKNIGLCTINITYPNISDVGILNITVSDTTVRKDILSSDSPFEYQVNGDTCELSCNITDSVISITYDAYAIDTKYLYEKYLELEQELYDTRDRCNLIEDYGTYVYPDTLYLMNTDAATYDFDTTLKRDKRHPLKVHIRPEATSNPKFNIKCDPVKFDMCTLVFYIDKETIKSFDSTDPITLKLSSDSALAIPSNYYVYYINNNELINGWNCLKKPIKDFIKVGSPDKDHIESISIEIIRNNQVNTKDIYFSSVIFNQRMKPTLLLNFDGVYDNGFTYTYPYLIARNIPSTIFTNTGTTLTKDNKTKLCKYYYTNKWDIGSYGCHPNKELLLEIDNEFTQYTNLINTKSYIEQNFRANNISYSAPYGNMQDITMSILQNMGYKIARIENSKDTYCSFFGKHDFCMPVIKVGNKNNAEEIIEKIDYAIETGQTIALYTNNVTEYGTESSLKEITFEAVLDHVLEKINEGKLQALSFEEFYKACIED